MVAGYAVDACWELPSKMPVTNPAADFPLTANQPEAYEFYVNLHNGEPITELPCCGVDDDPSDTYFYSKQWAGHTAQHFAWYSEHEKSNGSYIYPCGDQWPDEYCNDFFSAGNFPNGDYMGVAINFCILPDFDETEFSYTVFEFTVDLQ